MTEKDGESARRPQTVAPEPTSGVHVGMQVEDKVGSHSKEQLVRAAGASVVPVAGEVSE